MMWCHIGARECPNKIGGTFSARPHIAFLVASDQFLVALSHDSCYREIEIQELRPGGKLRRAFCLDVGGIMSGGRSCNNRISFRGCTTDFDHPGDRAIVF
jgi:hypothetical protein